MHISSDGRPRLCTQRKGLFTLLLEALHHSRRRTAIRALRRYRHLIAADAGLYSESYVPQSRQTEKSIRDASDNSALIDAIRQVRQNTRSEFA
jgi:hypothetical protein